MITEKETKFMFKDYCLYFQKRLSDKIKEIDFKNVKIQLKSVYENYYNDILHMSIFALTYELNNERIACTLEGSTSSERFQFFEHKFSDEKEIEKFLSNYEALDFLIKNKERQVVSFLSEIIENLNADMSLIMDKFSIDVSKIDDLSLGQGDTHNDGKTVAILTFGKTKLVYKPHSLKPDIIMNKLINKINKGIKYELKGIEVLDKGTYGYQEYKSFIDPTSVLDNEKLYYRLGTYLGMFYLMNSSDMHYENIIVCNDMPYIIDTETLMNPSTKLYVNQEEYQENYNTLEDSVLVTCLLPYKTENGLFDMDLSGLFGEEMTSKKLKTTKISDIGLDTMKISRELISNHVDTKQNKPSKFNAIDFENEFIEGFTSTLSFVLNYKDDFINFFDDKSMNNLYFRQVLRATLIYARFLEASYNPEYLESIEKRKQLFNVLTKNTSMTQRIESEIDSLLNNDVPCYEICYSDNALYSKGKLVDMNYFLSTLKETIMDKLEYLTKESIQFQVELIKASFNTKLNPFFSNKDHEPIEHVGKYLSNKDCYTAIFENYRTKEHYNFNTKGIDMIMNKLLPSDQLLTGINISLYEGLGMLLSYIIYQDKMGILKNKKELINNVVNLYTSKKEQLSIGVFDGMGSMLYFLYNLYCLQNDSEIYEQYEKVVCDIEQKLNTQNTFYGDVLYGISGLIITLWNIKNSGDLRISKCLDRSIFILQNLLNSRVDVAFETVGMAHGLSGICYACAIAYKHTGENYFKSEMNELLNIENEKITNIKTNSSWCRGYGGLILARLKINEIVRIDSNSIEMLIAEFMKCYTNVSSLCLCHGVAGNIEVMSSIIDSKISLPNNKKSEMQNYLTKAYRYINDCNSLSLGISNNGQLDTFMLGSSGVAYTLMKQEIMSLPSFLTLEIYRGD